MAEANNPIKYSDLISPDDSIDKLIRKLDELSDTYMNLAKNVAEQAGTISSSLTKMNAAVSSGRSDIGKSSGKVDELTRAWQRYNDAASETREKIEEVNQMARERQRITKLEVQLNGTAETSYNHLSAKYSLMKIQINNLTKEERENTKWGRELVEESKRVYEEMKRLQEATGKHQLNVGNYADAAKELRSELRQLTSTLAAMRMEGKEGTEEYRQLSERAGKLEDAMRDARKEISNMASDTSALDSVMQGLGAASGGLAVATGAMNLFGSSSEDVQEAQKQLQSVIAITNGVTQLQNAVQSQSALMLGVSKVQTYALAKAEAYERLIKIQGTKATLGATVAQKAFNLVAKMNPYVLIATALVTVVGALVLFTNGTKKAAEAQKRLNEQEAASITYHERVAEELARSGNERIAQLEREKKVATARNAGTSALLVIDRKILEERTRNHNKLMSYYSDEVYGLEKNRKTAAQLNAAILQLSKVKPNKKMRVEIDGTVQRGTAEKLLENLQKQLDNVDKKINVGEKLTAEAEDLKAAQQELAAQRAEAAKSAAKTELDALRSAEDARLELIQNNYDRERAQAQASARRAIEDIQLRLRQENNLTLKAREALRQQITSIREQSARTLQTIDNKQAAEELAAVRETEDAKAALLDDSFAAQRDALTREYERRMQDLTRRMETETGLTEKQYAEMYEQLLLLQKQFAKQMGDLKRKQHDDELAADAEAIQTRLDVVRAGTEEELALRLQAIENARQRELYANSQKTKEMRIDEALINEKYDKEALTAVGNFQMSAFDKQQKYEQSVFDLTQQSEAKRRVFQLRQQKARLQEQLRQVEAGTAQMSAVEVQTAKNTIAKLEKEISNATKGELFSNIYDMVDQSLGYALDAIAQVADARAEAAQKAVEASDKEVEAAQKALDAEKEARANGYANNVEEAQKELDLAKRTQEQALKQQEKARKQQAAIETVQQAQNLVSASAMIWSQLGFPWAIPAIATMWASFAAAKIKAAQITRQTEQYGEGTVELLEGGSHQSGNDIDLGTKSDGTRRRAEGGEFFAVINKRNSRRFRREIPSVIHALNDGTFAAKYLQRFDTSADGMTLNVAGAPDLRDLSADVHEIRKQGQRQTYSDGGYTVTRYKNVVRRARI